MLIDRIAIAIALVTAAGVAAAAPFAPFDLRATGMGGTGVASSKAAAAAMFNPAMLSAQKADHSQFILGVGAHVAGQEELLNKTEAMVERFAALDGTLRLSDLPQIRVSAERARVQLQDADGEYIFMGGSVTTAFGMSGEKLGVGVFVTANAYADVVPNISTRDGGTLRLVINDIADNQVADDPVTQALISAGELQVASTGEATGALVSEVGVAFSHRFEFASGRSLAVGITPKAVDVATYHYEETLDNFDDAKIDSTTVEKVGRHADLDLGVAYRTAADSKWQYGLVVRNLADKTYTTVPGRPTGLPLTAARDVTIDTQVRIGAARMTDRTTLAFDLDLTESENITPGSNTQFLAVGGEYALKYFQVRGGYRANLVSDSNTDDLLSLGLGLGPVDVSVIANKQQLGAFLGLGMSW